MQRVQTHLAVVVSASETAQRLRCDLIEAGVAPSSLASHVRGLRRSLVLGEYERVTLCIDLDTLTLQRHADALRRLLRDRRSFPTTVTAIGITDGRPLSAQAASLGCDVYLDDLEQTIEAVCFFERSTNVHGARCTMSVEPESWASTFIDHPVDEPDRASTARHHAGESGEDHDGPAPRDESSPQGRSRRRRAGE